MGRFIITGSPRSVTSYRCHALNRSPSVSIFDEINLYGKSGMFNEKFFTDYERYFQNIAKQLSNKVLPHQKYSPVLDEEPRNSNYTLGFLRGRFYQYLQRDYEDYSEFCSLIENEIEEFLCGNYDMVGDKMPVYISNLDKLLGYYPEMKAVLCYRDPYQIARSFYTPNKECTEWWQTSSVQESVEQCNKVLHVLSNSLKVLTDIDKERIFIARYEDLNTNFKEQWYDIIDFLDIDEGRVVKWARNSFDYREYDDISETIKTVDESSLQELENHREFFGYD